MQEIIKSKDSSIDDLFKNYYKNNIGYYGYSDYNLKVN